MEMGKKKSKDSLYLIRDEQSHYIIVCIYIYIPNIGASKYINKILIDFKGEVYSISNFRGIPYPTLTID